MVGYRCIPLLAFVCVAQEPPHIKVNVHLVNVTFSVRNDAGLSPANLTKSDFEVFEDGVPQNVSFFSRSADLPLTLGLIVDASGSQEHFVKAHHHDLESFLKGVLQPNDRAFLMGFGNHIRLVSDFTASSSEILDDLKRYEHESGHFDEVGPTDEDREGGTAFYDAIYYAASEKLSDGTSGRKALIIFSDGEDNSSAHHMLDAIEEAQIENVPLFCVRYTQHGRHGKITARNKYGTSVMARIAKESGGEDFDAEKKDLKESFREIGEELRSSYELAYNSTNTERDGYFRRIVIRSRNPLFTVRAKTGYYAR
ncbi:MAG: VWA domain-containing protein [Bryobacteraceae bacterium]|jgi:VWFA-related protein